MAKQHLKIIGSLLTKPDLLLIILILITAGLLFFTQHSKSDLKTVYIYDHGELLKTLPLTEKQQIITLQEGIKIEIMNFKVRMLSSTCPQQTCVKQGWSDNLPIVCVPNQIVLVIKSNKAQEKMLITS